MQEEDAAPWGRIPRDSSGLWCPAVKYGTSVPQAWLHKNVPVLWRLGVEMGGTASLALLPRACLSQVRPPMEDIALLHRSGFSWAVQRCRDPLC